MSLGWGIVPPIGLFEKIRPRQTFLAAYGAMEHLEGPPVEGAVILRFPTMQAARDWYHSPAYQTIAAHRFAGSRYRAFVIEGRR